MHYLIVSLAVICSMSLSAQANDATRDTLVFRADVAKTFVDVTISIPPHPGKLELEISRWAGVRDFDKNLSNVTIVRDGRDTVTAERPDDHTWAFDADNAPVTVTYRVTPPDSSRHIDKRNIRFHPTLTGEVMQLWGYALFLYPIDSLFDHNPARLEISAPDYQPVYVTVHTGEMRDILNALIVGGDYRVTELEVDGVPLTFHITGHLAFSDSAFVSTVAGIISQQASWLGSYPAERMMIVLSEGPTHGRGGTVVTNGMALELSPEDPLSADDMAVPRLIAHENTHVWVGHTLDMFAYGFKEGHFKWFQEGVPDYYSYLTLLRLGLWTPEQFLDRMNRVIVAYYENPYAFTATADSMEVHVYEDRNYSRLPYDKGALVAWLVDLQAHALSDGARSYDDVIKTLLNNPSVMADGYTDEDLAAALRTVVGPAWDSLYPRLGLGADTLPLALYAKLLGTECDLDTVEVFDLGFKTEAREIAPGAVIVSVDPGSPAEDAGLMVSDTIAGTDIYFNDPSRECSLWVLREGMKEKITYRPIRRLPVPQIDATGACLGTIRKLARP